MLVAAISLTILLCLSGERLIVNAPPTRLAGPPPANGRHWAVAAYSVCFDGETGQIKTVCPACFSRLPVFYRRALDLTLYN